MTNLTHSSILALLPSCSALDAVNRINQAQTGIALVVDPCLIGIFTGQNLFQAVALGIDLATSTLADLMTRSPVALHESDAENLSVVAQQFQHHQLQYLPVINEQGMPVGVISHQTVLAALQHQAEQAEATLRRSEQTKRLLLDANPNLVIQLHRDGTYLDLSSAKRFKSLALDLNIQGKNVFEVMPAALAQERMQYVAQALQTGTPQTYEYEVEVEGERCYQEAQISTIEADEVLIVVRDITDRKRAEQELRESKQRLRTILESSPLPIFIKDRQGRYTIVNQAYEQMTQRDRSQLLGITDYQLLPADFAETCWNSDQVALSTSQPIVFEEQVPFADQACHVLVTKFPIYDSSGQPAAIGGILVDITDRKQIEIALQESEEKFRQLASYIQDVFWIAASDSSSLYVSPAFEKIWGQSVEAVYRDPSIYFDSIHPDDRERIRNIIAERNQHGGESNLEYRIVRPDGEIRWIHDRGFPILDKSGQVYRAVGIASDITNRKLSEEALQQSEACLRSLVENLPFGCWIRDTEQRHILQNAADIKRWGNLIGLAENELSLPQELREQWKQRNQRALAGEIVKGEEQHLIDGQLCTFFHIMAPVRSNDDLNQETIHGTVGVSIDITDRKQIEESLQQAKEAAEAANRAKSEFLSRMSHELRTPLTSVLGFADLIARDTSLNPEHQEHLAIIRRSGTHLLNLINSVLEMSRIEAGEVILNEASFNLYHLLEDLRNLFQLKAAAKGLTLSVVWNPELPQHIQTDENKLRQVLINLLDNAIKFTETGEVLLRVSRGQEIESIPSSSPLSRPPSPPHSVSLRFQITDTGTGIAADELGMLFNAFTQAEAGRKLQQGTGLGLAISRQFVQMMGGEITVESQLGQGTILTFEIRAILTQPNPKLSTAVIQHPVIRQATSMAYRILVVDDQMETRKILARLLKPIGFEVQEAANGQDAVALWQSWQPHLIWMDMRMPVMNGYTATREIRAREQARTEAAKMKDESGRMTDSIHSTAPQKQATSLIPHPAKIIALTANAFDQQRSSALAAGCDDVVVKPFQPTEILQKIAEHLALDYFHAENQPSEELLNETLSEPFDEPLEEFFNPADSLIYPPLTDLQPPMPANWSADLRDAALRLHAHQCLKLIEQIPKMHKPLAQQLTGHVNRFQFDAIVSWVEQPK